MPALATRLLRYLPPPPDPSEDVGVCGARTVFSRAERWGLLAAFALVLVLRLPRAWAVGRFQDEEATVFLAYAWHHDGLDALFRPFAGYWNLGANATTLLVARLVQGGILPLERAPYVTMAIALAFQALPAVLILTGSGRWLAARLAVIAALLTIAIMPATEEVFFNVLHIQFHLALCAGLILALDVPRRRIARIGYHLLLFLAPLCGPGAIVILPLFALRALVDRDRGRFVQCAAFAAGAAVQLLLFYGATPLRGHLIDPATVAAAMSVRLVALPAFGVNLAYRFGGFIYASQMAGGAAWWAIAAATCLLFGVLLLRAFQRRDAAIWLLLSSLGIAAASLGFGMVIVTRASLVRVYDGERYNFLPLVLLGLALIALARRQEMREKAVYASLCALMLLTGARQYPQPNPDFAEGPSWPAEVAAWRRDHHHPLAVWPRPWAADLSDETRACSPPGKDLAQWTDPRYCESGWAAGFFPRK
jgi:hypothetical protein